MDKSKNEEVKSIFINLIAILNRINGIYIIYDFGNSVHIIKKLFEKYRLYKIKELNYEPFIFEKTID